MKKFLFVLVVLFIANVGCKKTSINGGTTCGCSPIIGTELYLVVKNSAGQDLLDDKLAGAITKDKIDLYRKDAAGNVVRLNFSIRPQFYYGEQKFGFNQLFTNDLSYLQKSTDNTIYLKLADSKLYELNIVLSTNVYRVDKVLIDKTEAEKDNGAVASFVPIFYLTK